MNKDMNRQCNPGKRLIGLCLTMLSLTTQTAIIARPSGGSITSCSAPIGLLSSASAAGTDETKRKRIDEAYGKLPLCFEPGDTRADSRVRFVSRSPSSSLFLTDTEAVLTLSRADVLRIKMAGANPKPLIEGVDQLRAPVSYLVGNDPSKWRTNVPRYAGVRYRNIYPGIDLTFHGSQNQLDCEIVLKPGARPDAVRFSFEGAQKMHLDSKGDLILRMGKREIRQRRPVIYQEVDGVRKEIGGQFTLDGKREVRFKPGSYDTTRSMVITPALSYSTYFGSTDKLGSIESGFVSFRRFEETLFVDSKDNVYLIAGTNSTDFPTTENAFRERSNGHDFLRNDDIIVSKIDPSKSGRDSLVYSTYLGGSSMDFLVDAFVDQAGNVFLIGNTGSTDFPTTENAFRKEPRDGDRQSLDVFVTRIDPSKSGKDSLVYSTHLGGSFENIFPVVFPIAFAGTSGNVYLIGHTFSNDFPITENAFQQEPRAAGRVDRDIFVARIDTSKSGKDSLVYAAYLGGSQSEFLHATVTDIAGNIYLFGTTSSSDFPTTPNAFQVAAERESSFVTRIDTSKTSQASLAYSTFFGNRFLDGPGKIATDSTGVVYLGGSTRSNDFPTTENAFQKGPRAAGRDDADFFISKIDPSKSGRDSLVYSSYLGGSGEESVFDLSVSSAQDIYVTGRTESNDFPTTASAFQRGPRPAGTDDFDLFVTRIDPSKDGQGSLVYSTYLGGQSFESLQGSFIDSLGNVFLAGFTISDNFPLTRTGVEKGPLMTFALFAARIDTSKTGQNSLIYSVFLGGSDFSRIWDFFVDGKGTAYVVGETISKDLPTHLPLQAINGGFFFEDAFVTKLDPEGHPVYSTYLGGRGFDAAFHLVVDSTGTAYVFGVTGSPDFPVTGTGYLTEKRSQFTTFITRVGEAGKTGSFRIANVSVVRDTLLVVGEGFIRGAAILVDGKRQPTKMNRQDSTVLMSESAGRKIKPARKISVRVRNPDGSLTEPVEFTRQSRRIF